MRDSQLMVPLTHAFRVQAYTRTSWLDEKDYLKAFLVVDVL